MGRLKINKREVADCEAVISDGFIYMSFKIENFTSMAFKIVTGV